MFVRPSLRWSVAFLMIWGCGDEETGIDLTTPASLTVIPSVLTLDAVGATGTLSATVRDALGGTLGSQIIEWTSENPAVATVNNGMVTGAGLGNTQITATIGALTRTTTVFVAQAPEAMTAASGQGQSAVVTSGLPQPLVVQVNDRLGAPVPGLDINWSLTGGSGTLNVLSATTGADGRAAAELTLGNQAGAIYRVEARLALGLVPPFVFTATGLADAPVAALVAGGDGQRNPISVALPQPIQVAVQDQHGNGVPGFNVPFAVSSGGGSLSASSADTDANGVASVVWTLGGTLGAQGVEVALPALNNTLLNFTATGTDLAITSVAPGTLVEGSPGQIVGTGFEPTMTNNIVTVDGVSATVTAATVTTIDFIVPTTSCRPSRSVGVTVATVASGVTPPTNHPLEPGLPVALAIGEQIIIQNPNDFCFQFLASGPDEEYLIGVQMVSDASVAITGFNITAETPTPGPAFLASNPAPPPTLGGRVIENEMQRVRRQHREAEVDLRRREAELIASMPAARVAQRAPSSSPVTSAATIPANVSVGDIVTVRVPSVTQANFCTNFTSVQAEVMVVGTRGVFLRDTNNDPNGFLPSDYQALSTQFDSDIYDTDAAYFGAPSDLDGNNRVAVIITRALNNLNEQILGFVVSTDLFDPADCPSSNNGEIFYTKDVSSNFPRSFLLGLAPPTIAHELAHIIQSSRRLIVGGGAPTMVQFMKEGQATLAEELVGYAVTGLPLGGNYGYAVAFNDPQSQSSAWFEFGHDDLSFYFGRSVGGARINGAPEVCSWIQVNANPCVGRPLWYGVTWSFLRWLGDNYAGSFAGGEQELNQRLIDNTLRGFENIEDVIGIPIDSLLAQWGAALYLDDRVAVTGPLDFSSWDFVDVYRDGNLPASAELLPDQLSFGGAFTTTGSVIDASTAYYLIDGPNRPATAIRIRNTSDGLLPGRAQVFLVRTR